MVGLAFLNGLPFTQSMAVSADGSIVVSRATDFATSNQAFLWISADGNAIVGDRYSASA
jgi:hypothetical protein